ncbi:hypothetical protein N018_12200 [Pseudomonas syringae CC1557]|uniref:Uncharacterized protein n=1 Tax=Pseudomonas syringae CC1557 TaxID=1357279 RepID=W0MYR4_PSESX|nr:hypothetical protein N018_12200 [Pseudomonas syringae CC1557]
MTDKTNSPHSLWAKIIYFPLAILACCELAFWATLETLPILQKAALEIDPGGLFYALSFLLPFVLWPIYAVISAIACFWAFFSLRHSARLLKLVTVMLAVLSVAFFYQIFCWI